MQGAGLPGLPRNELLGYMGELAQAIDFLNEPRHPGDDGSRIGVQHRNVKPQNRVVERHPGAVLGLLEEPRLPHQQAQENLFQDPPSEFRGRYTHLSCSFKGTELGGSLGSGDARAA